MIKIGLQGAKGSFSEEAAEIFVKNHGIEDYEFKYLISSKNVLKSLENNEINLVLSLWKMLKVAL